MHWVKREAMFPDVIMRFDHSQFFTRPTLALHAVPTVLILISIVSDTLIDIFSFTSTYVTVDGHKGPAPSTIIRSLLNLSTNRKFSS
jgi:hypothetical protein